MSLTRSVAHNTLLQATGRVVSIIMSLAVFFLVARYLGVEGYGSYTTATAFLQFFGIVVDLGLYVYLAKTLGEPGTDEAAVVSDVFTLRIFSALVVLGVAPLIILAFPYSAIVKASVLILALSSFFVTATQALAAVFQKHLVAGRFIGAELLGRAALLALTFLVVRLDVGLVGVVWTVVIGSAIGFAATVVWARRLVKFRLRWRVDAWRRILAATWPIALSIAFNVVYFKADTIVLSLYYPVRDVGIYGAPYRVFEALISIPALFAGLMTPILSGAYALDRQRFTRLLQRGFEVLLVAAVGLVVGTQFVARSVMTLVAPEFVASGPVLQILVLGTAAIFLGYLFSNVVVVVNQQRRMMWVYLAVALSSLALYLVFIPRFSYWGAAWVTVGVESIVALASAVIVLRTSGAKFTYARTLRTFVAGAVMAAAMWLGRDLPWYVDGVIGVVAYGAAIMALGVIDRATVREVLSRQP